MDTTLGVTFQLSDDLGDEFEKYWVHERKRALQCMSEEEQLDADKLEKVIGTYLFTEKETLKRSDYWLDDPETYLKKSKANH